MKIIYQLCAAVIIGVLPVQIVTADLNDELNELFDGLINVTPPDTFTSARRGVVSGGSLYVRTKIVKPNVLNFQPPTLNGNGCNIDMFGGSFSFLKGEELEELVKSIMTNSEAMVTYMFFIALRNMCPSCAQNLENLKNAVAKLNASLGNSCKISQNVLEGMGGSVRKADANESGPLAFIGEGLGIVDDAFNAAANRLNGSMIGSQIAGFERSGGQFPADVKKPYDLGIEGNLVWRAIVGKDQVLGGSTGVSEWFLSGSGDHTLLETLLSFLGTVVYIPPVDQAGNPIDGATNLETVWESTVDLNDLLYSDNEIEIYQCPSSDLSEMIDQPSMRCVNQQLRNVPYKGIVPRINEMMLGQDGIVVKLKENNGVFTDDQKKFIGVLAEVGYLDPLRSLAGSRAKGLADKYADSLSQHLGLIIVRDIVRDIFRATAAAGAAQPEIQTWGAAADLLRRRQDQVQSQMVVLGDIERQEQALLMVGDYLKQRIPRPSGPNLPATSGYEAAVNPSAASAP